MGRALALLETGVIEVEPLISGVLNMEEMAEELKNRTLFRKGKVLLKVFGEGA